MGLMILLERTHGTPRAIRRTAKAPARQHAPGLSGFALQVLEIFAHDLRLMDGVLLQWCRDRSVLEFQVSQQQLPRSLVGALSDEPDDADGLSVQAEIVAVKIVDESELINLPGPAKTIRASGALHGEAPGRVGSIHPLVVRSDRRGFAIRREKEGPDTAKLRFDRALVGRRLEHFGDVRVQISDAFLHLSELQDFRRVDGHRYSRDERRKTGLMLLDLLIESRRHPRHERQELIDHDPGRFRPAAVARRIDDPRAKLGHSIVFGRDLAKDLRFVAPVFSGHSPQRSECLAGSVQGLVGLLDVVIGFGHDVIGILPGLFAEGIRKLLDRQRVPQLPLDLQDLALNSEVGPEHHKKQGHERTDERYEQEKELRAQRHFHRIPFRRATAPFPTDR